MDVSRKLQGRLKGVLREVLGCFKEVSRVFHESLMEEEVSRMFQGCFMIFKDVSRVFQGSFKKTFKVFQKVSSCMALIAASRAEGGLVFMKMTLHTTHSPPHRYQQYLGVYVDG